MTNLRETRLAIIDSYDRGFIDDEEFVLLYDSNKSTNLDLPYWDYENFDLEKLNDDECKSEFRFEKNDVYTLYEVLDFPEEIRCRNNSKYLE